MFGKRKATHAVSGDGQPPSILGGPISVYGRNDRKTRQAAADKAGVKVTFRKLKRSER